MKLSTKFQSTELGKLPVEWCVRTLRELGKVHDGTHQTPKYVRDGVPFYSVEHVTSGDFNNTKFISLEEHRFLTRTFKMERGDVLMTRIGSIGECRLIDWDVDASFYVSLALLKLRDIDARYFAQYANSPMFKQEVELHSLPSAVPRKINLGPISDIRVAIPSVEEQRAIATALSDIDSLIVGLERLIVKKHDIKQATMQQLLTGQTRLPGFSGKWTAKELGELCSLKSGQTITTESIDDHSPYRCFGGNGLRGFTATYTHDGSHVLIGRQGALCGNVIGVEGKFFASEHALVASVRSDVATTWLTYVLGRMNLNQYSESSAQPGLSAAKLLVLDVLSPPTREEQAAIAAILSDMDIDLAALESRLAKTRAIKQGMMQELLTGRTRLV
ncbi:restriction endonuclease subunit S [uncultured Comamonas sp.]|uniref:restriction endonuclease subunit S n=1 Tax=uncultured Comamonas sp. TaxID=114710 RepID=UPI0037499133